MNRFLSNLAGWLVGALLVCSGAQAGYTTMYTFGDSLVDTGNFNLLTDSVVPGGLLQAPYVNGRFTNGPVYSELVAASLGLSAAPSYAGGTNYAVGGARTDGSFIPALSPIASLQAQLGIYFAGTGGSADANALYLVSIGSNDLFDAIDTGSATGGLAVASNAATITAQSLINLVAAGARNLVVPNVTNLGLTPLVPNVAKPLASFLVTSFNSVIDGVIQNLVSSTAGLRIARPDFYSLLNDAASNPGNYGFTNVTTPCYDGFVLTPGTSVCSKPDENLFWDVIHPTAAGHEYLAQSVLVSLPEPQTWLLMLVAFGALYVTRRRRV